MAGLKELRTRIESIKSTQKITSAMKMVAAARLRRAQTLISRSEPYSRNLDVAAMRVLHELKDEEQAKGITYLMPKLMHDVYKPQVYVLLVFTSSRGLCGNYNHKVAKLAAQRADELLRENKLVTLITIGKKGHDILKKKYGSLIIDRFEDVAKKGAEYNEAADLANKLMESFEKGEVDVVEMIYAKFHSVINTEPTVRRLVPIDLQDKEYSAIEISPVTEEGAAYDYEPDKLELLGNLLPMMIKENMFECIVQSQASEHGARMTSMDNATRNASDMISKLTLRYNRARQSAITTELTEIIAGAEAI